MTILIESQMTREEAERISNRIGLRLDTMADNWSGALPLIREAIERSAYLALDYPSHGAYVSDRFGDSLAKLGMELRREIVRELTDAGLSTRAIAPVFGVSHKTIVKDRQATEVVPEVPPADFDPTPTLPPRADDWSSGAVGNDGLTDSERAESAARYESGVGNRRVSSAAKEAIAQVVNRNTGEVINAPVTTTETHTIKTVVGLDGKNYTTTPRQAPRPSLIDDARSAGFQLRKAIERLERIREDDRYTRNKAEIVAALQPHLDLANKVFADL